MKATTLEPRRGVAFVATHVNPKSRRRSIEVAVLRAPFESPACTCPDWSPEVPCEHAVALARYLISCGGEEAKHVEA